MKISQTKSWIFSSELRASIMLIILMNLVYGLCSSLITLLVIFIINLNNLISKSIVLIFAISIISLYSYILNSIIKEISIRSKRIRLSIVVIITTIAALILILKNVSMGNSYYNILGYSVLYIIPILSCLSFSGVTESYKNWINGSGSIVRSEISYNYHKNEDIGSVVFISVGMFFVILLLINILDFIFQENKVVISLNVLFGIIIAYPILVYSQYRLCKSIGGLINFKRPLNDINYLYKDLDIEEMQKINIVEVNRGILLLKYLKIGFVVEATFALVISIIFYHKSFALNSHFIIIGIIQVFILLIIVYIINYIVFDLIRDYISIKLIHVKKPLSGFSLVSNIMRNYK